jgi:hypothetical protein
VGYCYYKFQAEPTDRAFIDQVLAETLNRGIVLARVREYFRGKQSGGDYAG